MSQRKPPIRLLTACVVLAATLALTACGGDKKSSSGQQSGDVETQLGFDQAGIIARQSHVEAAIAKCMKNEGFDYTPVDPLAQRAAILGSGRLTDEDFIKQFGYGISTLWGRGNAQGDPNLRIRLSLSPSDRRAYDFALGGDYPGVTFTEAVDSGDFSKLGGCTKKATQEAFGGAQVLTELQGKLDALDERIQSDQRMVNATQKWAQCMAKLGYRYDEPDSIDTDFFRRMEAIVGKLPGQFATGPLPGTEPEPYDHAKLAALQRDEVATARADFNCEKQNITPVEQKVTAFYQNQFRQQNHDLMSQVKPVTG